MTKKNSSTKSKANDSSFGAVGESNPINEPKAEAKPPTETEQKLNESAWKITCSVASRTFYYPKGPKFYYRGRTGEYLEFPEQLLMKFLTGEELFARIFAAQGGSDLSLAERNRIKARTWAQFIHYVVERNTIDWAGELAGIPAGLFHDNGYRCLITRGPTFIIPKEGDCSWIDQIMAELFPEDQIHVIEAAMTRMYRHKTDPDPNAPYINQIIIMAGETDCGKSLFKDEIFVPLLGGRFGDAISFISGATFNGELGRADVAVIDDQNFDTRFDQDVVADRLKKFAADRNKRIEDKNKTAINVRSKPAMLILLNLGSKNLRLSPDLTEDIEGKLLGFLCGKITSIPRGEGHEKIIQAKIKEQLPAYLYKLLHKRQPPEGVVSDGRFGVCPFFHPKLRQAREDEDYAITVLELITQVAIRDNKPTWTASPTEIFQELTENLSNTRNTLSSFCKNPKALGWQLSKLARTRPGRVKKEPHTEFGAQYTIVTEIPESESAKPPARFSFNS